MLHLVNRTVYADGLWCAREGFVKRGLLYIGPEAVNCFQARGGVDGEQVWAQTDMCSILLVSAVEGKMPRSFVRIVGEVDVCDFGEKRTWVFGEWVQGQSVDDHTKNLVIFVLVKVQILMRGRKEQITHVASQASKDGSKKQ